MSTTSANASAHDAALARLIPDGDRAAHESRVHALLARNQALLAVEAAREEVAMSKKQLADAAEMDASSLRKLLLAESANPTTDSLFRLFDALGIKLEASTPSGKTFQLL